MRHVLPVVLLSAFSTAFLPGCLLSGGGGSSASMSSCASGDDDDDAASGDDDDEPKRLDIEESDIYRIEGARLFVYSYTKGLTVIDTSDAGAPSVTGQVALPASAGELYVRDSRVLVVTETSPACDYGHGEVVAIDATIAPPAISSRVCLAATPVASRLVGNVLHAVSTDTVNSWVESVGVGNPSSIGVQATLQFPGNAGEIHMNDEALYISHQPAGDYGSTQVRYVDVADGNGALTERGSITVTGVPQGRFHMDARGTHFRIVTYDWNASASTLHVIDVSNPDALVEVGTLAGIAPGEQLHATRFVDDRAYVVTFFQTDPLWVIGLADPAAPVVLGELEIPGWSDFLFPRGDRLVAVGRGDGGSGVGVSLFDVSDPSAPASLGQLAFGDWAASSEANLDFRGVGIHEPQTPGAPAMLALPINAWDWGADACRHTLQLVDVSGDAITARGLLQESAAIRRSTPVGGRLLAISDLHVASIDVSNPDAPVSTASVSVGDPAFAQAQCFNYVEDWGNDFEGTCGGCSVALSVDSRGASAVLSLASVLVAGLLLRRRR